MEEDGKVFSDYDVDLTSGRTWFQGVSLYEVTTAISPVSLTNLDNGIFKIMLLNNG